MRPILQLLLLVNATVVVFDAARHLLGLPDIARAIQMIEDGSTQRQGAERFCVSRSVVARLCRWYQETGGYSEKPGQGCSHCTAAREDRYIVNPAL